MLTNRQHLDQVKDEVLPVLLNLSDQFPQEKKI